MAKAKENLTFRQARIQNSEVDMYFQLMEATAKMVTDDILDDEVIKSFWEEVQNAIYVIRQHSAKV